MATDSFTITNPSPATQIVSAGDGPTLILNSGPGVLYIGDVNTILFSDGNGVVPISPSGSFPVDGKNSMYGTIQPGQPTNVFTVAGGLSFFSPVTSITLPTGATSGARIVLNGLTSTITGYYASGRVAYVINPQGFFFYL